ncbi:ribonuclease pancreatic-like [Trichosurus vulpecula]|uniref:ribonuclease pancreatic-like n=1 Tax=Trichosurus vulpecula TaxID=9337 RepID=UPI00186B1C06|nr:ribonuclease pancreatic-like [Trichosurus vulpecula]
MAPERSLLLLPLLAMLVVRLVSSETPAERFERQHVDSDCPALNDNVYCNQMMRNRGMTQESCKEFNTFILENVQKIRAICWNTKAPCKDQFHNCHRSSQPLQVTECRLKGNSQHPQCKYKATNVKKHIIVSCCGWPLLPVHLDSSKSHKCLK